MAHNPLATSRALLGAGAMLPTRAVWAEHLGALAAAREAEDAYDRDVWSAANLAGNGRGPDDVEAEMARLQDVRCDVEHRVISAPAPDLAATIWKIGYARERWSDSADWPPEWWDAVMADLHRLEGQAERDALFRDFDRLDATAAAINTADSSDEELSAFADEHGAAFKRTIALPNTADYLRVRARAIGSCCNYNVDVANLDLNELSANAYGYAGQIIQQVLACLMQSETIR